MENSISQLHIRELNKKFPTRRPFQKSALRRFYSRFQPELSEQAFRRILYALEKRQVLTPIGAGMYARTGNEEAVSRENFVPDWSSACKGIQEIVKQAFPYLETLSWETGLLHEWMRHQPANNQIILEVEKDACESVFNHLAQEYPGQVFLEPDRAMMERYILPLPESILISRLVTQSPKKKLRGVVFPRLEKILVDIFVDSDKFFAFQGEELVHIFENVFSAYWINEKTLFRYAGRRNAGARLKNFIDTKTMAALTQTGEHQDD
ncbi:MAG: hypothetical protein KGZ86_07605 [Candidatus Latescibacteria bacterium]|nr:hypothetical protein [Candidatus Latescibacterota bacterium]